MWIWRHSCFYTFSIQSHLAHFIQTRSDFTRGEIQPTRSDFTRGDEPLMWLFALDIFVILAKYGQQHQENYSFFPFYQSWDKCHWFNIDPDHILSNPIDFLLNVIEKHKCLVIEHKKRDSFFDHLIFRQWNYGKKWEYDGHRKLDIERHFLFCPTLTTYIYIVKFHIC